MANELAVGYISLVASSRDLGKQITGDLGKAGDSAGKSAGGRLIGAMGGVLKKSALGVGAAVGGILTTAIFKGWNRLTDIENAQAKLSGLGNSAKTVQTVMGDALKSVKGTAFGLDEAATIAASATAAGIKPGKDLQRTLGLVADAATIGGTSLSDMGAIFNKVAASNKIQGDTIDQLNEHGIPIVQLLGKTLGKTSADVVDLASKGKINFAQFQKAMESGLGGAALKSGQTTQGAFKNMNAALGRFGVALLQGVFPAAKKVFGGITGYLDKLTDKTGPAMEAMTKRLVTVGKTLRDKMMPYLQNARADLLLLIHGDTEDGEGGWAVALHNGIVDAWKRSQPTLKKFKAEVTDLVGKKTSESWAQWGRRSADSLVKSIDSGWQKIRSSDEFTNTVSRLQSIWGKLADTGKRSLEPIVSIVKSLGLAFLEAFRTISNTGLSVWGLLLKAADAVASVLQTVLVPALNAVAKWMKDNPVVVAALATAFLAYKSVMLGITVATKAWTLATGVATAAQKLLNGAMKANPIGIVIALVSALAAGFIYLWNKSEGFRKFWIGLWNGIKKVIGTVWNWIKGVVVGVYTAITKAWRAIGGFFAHIWDVVKRAVSGAWSWIRSIIIGSWTAVKAAWNTIGSFFAHLWDVVKRAVSAAWGWIKSVIVGVWTAVKTAWNAIGSFFAHLWDVVKQSVSGAWTWIGQTIGGAFNAVKRAWNAIGSFFSGLWSGVQRTVVAWWHRIGEIIGAVVGPIKAVWNGIVGFFAGLWDGVKRVVGAAVGWISDRIDDVIDAAANAVEFIAASFGENLSINVGHSRGSSGWSRANGGPLNPGWTVVGEQGPELLFTSAAGGMVFSNPASRRMLASAAPASDSTDIGAQVERALSGWTVVADPTGVSRLVKSQVSGQVRGALAR